MLLTPRENECRIHVRGSKSEVGEVTIEDPLDPNLLTYSPSYQGKIDQDEIFRIVDKLLLLL